MATILDKIVQTKRGEVAAARRRRPIPQLTLEIQRQEPARDFFSAVTEGPGVRLIAEIKKASPSAGVIVEDFDAVRIARTYHQHAAAALSVLTDEHYFQGSLAFIEQVKEAVPLPVLRKDFIVDEYQVHESRAAGADAILLIAEVLEAAEMVKLRGLASEFGMTALIEVHSAEKLEVVLDALGSPGPDRYLLGINNRDLARQRVDLETTARLAATLPADAPFISESGIATREDVQTIEQAGAKAMLVGESLLRAKNIGQQVDRLLARTP